MNVKAALFVGQCVAKDMLARKEGGSIVNISSQASQRALPLHTVYCKPQMHQLPSHVHRMNF